MKMWCVIILVQQVFHRGLGGVRRGAQRRIVITKPYTCTAHSLGMAPPPAGETGGSEASERRTKNGTRHFRVYEAKMSLTE